MTEDVFWKIIEATKVEGAGNLYAQGDALTAKLSLLEPDEIIDFSQRLEEMMEQSYTQPLYAAASIVCGSLNGASEDAFDDFRAWLIGQGREVFMRALDHPDSLADVVDPRGTPRNMAGDQLLFCDSKAYSSTTGREAMTGGPLADHVLYQRRFGDPEGEPWQPSDLPTMLPRLWLRMRAP